MDDFLISEWTEAARDLGLEFDAPFSLTLPSGATVDARLRLRHFGGRRGMFIVTDWEALAPNADEVVDAGFGFSTLSERSSDEHYDRASFVSMLRDWTWSGPEELRPAWCTPKDEECPE